jgi:cathepsin D
MALLCKLVILSALHVAAAKPFAVLDLRARPFITTRPIALLSEPTSAKKMALAEPVDGQIIYTGTVFVGTPPREATVLFDTGSSDTWFSQSILRGSTTLQASKEEFEVSYESGSIFGTVVQDTLTVAGVTLPAFTMGSATFGSGFDGGMDGLIGLGLNSTASIQGHPFLEAMGVTSFKIELSIDSLLSSLEFFSDALSEESRDWLFAPVVRTASNVAQFWALEVSASYIRYPDGDTSTLSSTSTMAVIDSGTSVVYAPSAIYDALVDTVCRDVTCHIQRMPKLFDFGIGIGLGEPEISSVFCSNCTEESFPDVVIEFYAEKGKVVRAPLDPYYFTMCDGMHGTCQLLLMPQPAGMGMDLWLLGDTFLAQHPTLYDFNSLRIGFSPANTPINETTFAPDRLGRLNMEEKTVELVSVEGAVDEPMVAPSMFDGNEYYGGEYYSGGLFNFSSLGFDMFDGVFDGGLSGILGREVSSGYYGGYDVDIPLNITYYYNYYDDTDDGVGVLESIMGDLGIMELGDEDTSRKHGQARDEEGGGSYGQGPAKKTKTAKKMGAVRDSPFPSFPFRFPSLDTTNEKGYYYDYEKGGTIARLHSCGCTRSCTRSCTPVPQTTATTTTSATMGRYPLAMFLSTLQL